MQSLSINEMIVLGVVMRLPTLCVVQCDFPMHFTSSSFTAQDRFTYRLMTVSLSTRPEAEVPPDIRTNRTKQIRRRLNRI